MKTNPKHPSGNDPLGEYFGRAMLKILKPIKENKEIIAELCTGGEPVEIHVIIQQTGKASITINF